MKCFERTRRNGENVPLAAFARACVHARLCLCTGVRAPLCLRARAYSVCAHWCEVCACAECMCAHVRAWVCASGARACAPTRVGVRGCARAHAHGRAWVCVCGARAPMGARTCAGCTRTASRGSRTIRPRTQAARARRCANSHRAPARVRARARAWLGGGHGHAHTGASSASAAASHGGRPSHVCARVRLRVRARVVACVRV
jgi:hypothetical protein